MAFQIYNKKVSSGAVQIHDGATSSNANLPLMKPTDSRMSNMPLVQANQDNSLNELVQVIQIGAKIYGQKKAEQDEAQAFEAFTQLQKEQMSFEREYLATKHGKDAFNAHTDFANFTRENAERIAKDLKISDSALLNFGQRVSQAELSAFGRGHDYAQAQDTEYRNQTIAGMRSNHINLIAENPNDLARIAQSKQDLITAQESLFPGQDYTELFNQWDKDDGVQMINSAIAKRDVKTASSYYNEFKPKLGDAAPKMEIAIKQMQESVNNEYKQNVISAMANQAFADFPNDIHEAIRSIGNSGQSPEWQMASLDKYMQMKNFNEAVVSMKNKEFLQKTYTEGNTLFADPNVPLAEKMNYISQAPLEAQPTLTKNLDYAIHGFEGVTNKDYLQQLQIDVGTGALNIDNFNKVKQANLSYLSKSDWNSIEKLVYSEDVPRINEETKRVFEVEMLRIDSNLSQTELNRLHDEAYIKSINMGITKPREQQAFMINQAKAVGLDRWGKDETKPLMSIKDEDIKNIIVPKEAESRIRSLFKDEFPSMTKEEVRDYYINELNYLWGVR